tara:strand:+ start:423 stop:614 length:192 start_codon:yes stop_codon:yes gene_type:complete
MVYWSRALMTMNKKQLSKAIKDFAQKNPQTNLNAKDAQVQLVELILLLGENNAPPQESRRETQ